MIVHKKRNVFNKIPRFDKEIKEKANKIKENQFNKSHTRSTRIEYTGYNDTKYIITLNDPNCYANCSCSCSNFLKWAICHHVVAYSHCINKNWYGMKCIFSKFFQKIIRLIFWKNLLEPKLSISVLIHLTLSVTIFGTSNIICASFN